MTTYYIEVTNDKFALPLTKPMTALKLAKHLQISPSTIYRFFAQVSKRKTKKAFAKVEIKKRVQKATKEKKEYMRERYKWLKEHGICTECATRNVLEGFSRCKDCLKQHQLDSKEYNHSARRKVLCKARLKRRIKQGLCINCSNKIYEGSARYCERCHEKQKLASRIAQRKKYERERKQKENATQEAIAS